MHPNICEKCFSYMIDHPNLHGWKKCSCGYCKDKNGENLITKKQKEEKKDEQEVQQKSAESNFSKDE